MRSYLSLIPISARVRRRQNRMTLLCILFAVFLVTAIFSIADLFVQSETAHFPYFTWTLPVSSLLIILLFVLLATLAAVYAPAKRMREMAVTETINEL